MNFLDILTSPHYFFKKSIGARLENLFCFAVVVVNLYNPKLHVILSHSGRTILKNMYEDCNRIKDAQSDER